MSKTAARAGNSNGVTPAGVPDVVLTLKMDVPEPLAGGVTEFEVNEHVMPDCPHAFDKERFTAALNPFCEPIVIVVVSVEAVPAVELNAEGVELTLKSTAPEVQAGNAKAPTDVWKLSLGPVLE